MASGRMLLLAALVTLPATVAAAPGEETKPTVTPLDGEWAAVMMELRDTPEAELVVRVGDIDNLGFGWPAELDPFSGKNTPSHPYPFEPGKSDPGGTDRIMVPSSYDGHPPAGKDGYTDRTTRPGNAVEPVRLLFELEGIEVKGAILQMFVDDFQSPVWHSHFQVTLDGQRAPSLERTLNALSQTGPIGKMVTIGILPELMPLIEDGRLAISIDDPTTGAGDGFAIDFARLLVNPRKLAHTGTVSGTVIDRETRKPLAGALVTASDVVNATTDATGRYRLDGVPAGLVVGTAALSGYDADSRAADLIAGDKLTLDFALARASETKASISSALAREGRAVLYGIHFDPAKAAPRPDSEATLRQLLLALQADPAVAVVIEGHTDSDDTDEANLALSRARAEAVHAWLLKNGIAPDRLASEGHGESRPISDNRTAEGKAQNRRVEVVVRK